VKTQTLRELGAGVGSTVRFVDDDKTTTRTVTTEQQLDYPHLLPWILLDPRGKENETCPR